MIRISIPPKRTRADIFCCLQDLIPTAFSGWHRLLDDDDSLRWKSATGGILQTFSYDHPLYEHLQTHDGFRAHAEYYWPWYGFGAITLVSSTGSPPKVKEVHILQTIFRKAGLKCRYVADKSDAFEKAARSDPARDDNAFDDSIEPWSYGYSPIVPKDTPVCLLVCRWHGRGCPDCPADVPYPETRGREALGVIVDAHGAPWTFASSKEATEWYQERVQGTLRSIDWEYGQMDSDWHPKTRLLVRIVVRENPWIDKLSVVDAALITAVTDESGTLQNRKRKFNFVTGEIEFV